jgi:hypothetical protein
MAFVGNTPSAVPLTGSQIADGTIVNANIATNTINLTQKVTSALAATNGGTGTSSYTAGNILYASNATTLTTLAPGTSGYALTLNGTTPTWAAVGASAGQVIQVLSATDSTLRSTTSQSFVTASNTLLVSITPSSASNKIFIIVTASLYHATNYGMATIYRGSTNLGGSTYGMAGVYNGAGGAIAAPLALSYLDSPSTTSATTYQVYIKSGNADAVQLGFNTGEKFSITVMEIKG